MSLQLHLTLSSAGEPARAAPASTAEQGASYIKAAAAGLRLPPAEVLSAILALEKAKLPVRCCCERVLATSCTSTLRAVDRVGPTKPGN